jgi:periplasmic protein TonB
MAPQFAMSNYGPKRESPELLAARAGRNGDRPNRRHIAASLFFHFLVVFGIFLLPRSEPVDVPVPLVTLVLEDGSAGSAGGHAGGGGGGGGNGAEAGSAPAQSADADSVPEEQPLEEQAAQQQPSEPTPPRPQAAPEPPVPQALAPAPVVVPPPPPKPRPPAVKPRPPAARPARHAEEKPVEKPSPEPSPTVAAEPPPGSSNGPRAASAAQSGTAASGTASAGPGGAAGAGTGVAGAGRGSFGSGKGPGDDYLDRLRRHLAKYKHYPPEAVKRKEEGTVLLSFVLARDGTVLEAAVERSSGFPLIDQAALDMVRHASPVPPLPASFDGDRAHIVMPAGFRIGFFDRLF